MAIFTPLLIAAATVTVFAIFLRLIRIDPNPDPVRDTAERGISELEIYLQSVSHD